ncbi:MAG: LysM peptidoglycan-binding domain-containing protein [Desulfobacteraceae bacterium]|nr:LysM peptidoglycan-binding domain-containing protein [Desulfobacteraceae bacterium]
MKIPKRIALFIVFLLLGFVLIPSTFATEKKASGSEEDASFFYTIQKGDTLWDLSQKFYNSNWDWPGLWELNEQKIKNPHWIYPGKKIRIFLKDRIFKKKAPPQIAKAEPVPSKPPEKIEVTFSYTRMNNIGFIKDKQVPSLGKVIKENNNQYVMGPDDIIYIKPSGNGELLVGAKYHIFSTEKVTKRINGRHFTGIKHLIRGELEILEFHGSYAKAKILKSIRITRAGHMLMPYQNRVTELKVKEDPSPIDAIFLCSEENNALLNDKSVSFIDLGKKDNIKPGQMYTIFKELPVNRPVWPNNKEELPKLNSDMVGKLIVLHTEEKSSTVLILSSSEVILEGDQVN